MQAAAALICTLIISVEDPDQVESAKDPDPHLGPADPNPEREPLPLNVKLNYTYFQKISKYRTVQKNMKIMTPMTLTRKLKTMKTDSCCE